MKRTLTVAAVACGLISAGLAEAELARTVYTGPLDGEDSTRVRVEIAERDGALQLTKFTARHFDVTCTGGVISRQRVASVHGNVRIGGNGGLRINDDNGKTSFRVAGAVGRNKVFGKFRFSGLMETATGSRLECDSGQLLFVARA